MSNPPGAVLWIDLETTGASDLLDEIIEVGTIITDLNFDRITEDKNWVVRPSEFAYKRLLTNKIVREMHQSNGLLDECVTSEHTIYDVTNQLCKSLDLLSLGPDRPVILAGSGVSHFDRKFIERYMRNIVPYLTRGPLDIGVVRLWLKMNGILEPSAGPRGQKNHRALDDIRLHFEESFTYRNLFVPVETRLRRAHEGYDGLQEAPKDKDWLETENG